MNEEKKAIEFLKHSLYEYEEIDTSVMEYIDKNHKIIYKLILKQQKEIEDIKKIGFYNTGFDKGVESVEYRIKEKLEEIEKEYNNLFTQNLSHDTMNINSHRFDAMRQVLRELLKG